MTRSELIDAALKQLYDEYPYLCQMPVQRLLRLMATTVFTLIADTLAAGERVQIVGLGTFDIYTDKGRVVRSPKTGTYTLPPTKRLRFRPSRRITQQLKGTDMDKYGVQQDDEKTKTASETKTCPRCGSPNVDWTGNVPVCPNCGTEPFEKKPEKPR